jgi:hypothetical protein
MLPVEGNVSVRDVAAIIQSAPQLLGVRDTLEIRAIAYPIADGTWGPFRRAVRVGLPIDAEPLIVGAGPLRLISVPGAASAIVSLDELRAHVWSAPTVLGRCGVRDAFGGDHQSLRREWSTPDMPPAWRVDLGSPSSPPYGPPPYGPFPSPDHEFLAENAAEAAAKWFGVPGLVTQPNPTLEVSVAIHDRRAYFTSIKRGDDLLVIRLDRAIAGSLDVWLRMVDYAGAPHDQWIRNPSNEVQLPYQVPFRALTAYLFSPEGVLLDRVDESESSRSARADEIFGGERRERAEIADILKRGEGDTVEVKEWMPVDSSEPKAIELLQTACAFGNTRGGVILIGVTRQLGVVGVQREVQRLASRAEQPPTSALEHYARRLRQRLSDGITPNVAAEIDWVHLGGQDLCRIRIGRAPAGVRHRLYANRLAYLRLGANSVPATE